MDNLYYTKLCQGLKGYVNRKRKENPKTKVKIIFFDSQGEEIPYEKEIPEYDVINTELLNPDFIGYKILVGDQEVKNGKVKEPKPADIPQQSQSNIGYPQQNQALENNAMNFLFSTIMKSNEILAQSQEKNLASIMVQMQANTKTMFEQLQTSFADTQKRMSDQNRHDLEMQSEKFKFELEKRETLEAIGKDNVTFTDIISKATGFIEKVPMPIWGGIYEKLTGREMPTVGNGEHSDIVDGILKEVSE